MLGPQHALGGVAAWLVAVPVLDATVGLTPGQTVLGAFLSAGGGMLPDLDEPRRPPRKKGAKRPSFGSTISRTYGPLTNVVARVVNRVSGGHRHGTHSLAGLAVFGGLAALAAQVGGAAMFVAVWLLLGAADSAFGISPRKWKILGLGHALVMAVVTGIVLSLSTGVGVPLVAGTVLGVASHIGLDMLNPQRCPLWWPISKRRCGVSLTTTGSWVSPVVTLVLAAVVAALLVLQPTLGRLVG